MNITRNDLYRVLRSINRASGRNFKLEYSFEYGWLLIEEIPGIKRRICGVGMHLTRREMYIYMCGIMAYLN